MDEPAAVGAFDRAGSGDGPLMAQYELSARAIGKLLPVGGSVLDLGSGSARFLAYLAERRPDARIVGVELSLPMVELSRRTLAEEGLADRVRVVHADMTDCARLAPDDLGLLSCMLALHQLPSKTELSAALSQVAAIRGRTGCAVWLWDLVRLADAAEMEERMAQDPESDPLFHRDALASEAAAWTETELTSALEEAELGGLHHAVSQPPFLQVHWAPGRAAVEPAGDSAWRELAVPSTVRRRVIAMRLGFKGLP